VECIKLKLAMTISAPFIHAKHQPTFVDTNITETVLKFLVTELCLRFIHRTLHITFTHVTTKFICTVCLYCDE
jgi:hypothetical protein